MNIPEQWLAIFFVANYFLSAVAQALPEPDTTSSKGYIFFYKLFNLLIADFKSFAAKIPAPTITTTKGATVTTTIADPTPVVQK